MEANGDRSGPHWVATVQTAQHRLNRVAFGLLAIDNHLLLQLHRFKFQATFCKQSYRTIAISQTLDCASIAVLLAVELLFILKVPVKVESPTFQLNQKALTGGVTAALS